MAQGIKQKSGFALLLLAMCFLQACYAVPNENSVKTRSHEPSGLPKLPSIEDVREKQEQVFLEKTRQLQQRNPQAEAQAAIQSGRAVLKTARHGRGDIMIPGVSNPGACATTHEVSLSDALYGPNHIAYQQAYLQFLTVYNQTILPACQ